MAAPHKYAEPSPACYQSLGLDHEMKIKRSSELLKRRDQILLTKVILDPSYGPREVFGAIELPSRRPDDEEAETSSTSTQSPRRLPEIENPKSHSWPWQTVTESQTIGWFVDPKRHLDCRLREWPKNFSFV